MRKTTEILDKHLRIDVYHQGNLWYFHIIHIPTGISVKSKVGHKSYIQGRKVVIGELRKRIKTEIS